MKDFLIYDGKVALALLVLYLFYRFLLKKETFHRLNRVVLVGSAVLAFLLPLCIITIHKPMEGEGWAAGTAEITSVTTEAAAATPAWTIALTVLFWAGAAFVCVRLLVSILSILRIVRTGSSVREEGGCNVIVTDRDIDPFSWMKYIVLSRKDWEGDPAPILAHEKAHIGFGHSLEILLVDLLSSLQWFNPAIWMLRADLRELHEYEADDAVLRAGTDIKAYQYLLIRKAAGKSGYSVANSLNHSILKNRITMMSKTKSPLYKGLRALYLLPLLCLGVALQAKTVYVPSDKDSVSTFTGYIIRLDQDGELPLFILRQRNNEKEITKAEFDRIPQHRIRSIDVLKDKDAEEKYGEKAAHGVIVVTIKPLQELDGIVVVSYSAQDEAVPFQLLQPDSMPRFQGEDMGAFSRWLNRRIIRPEGCQHTGTMSVSFVVAPDGSVTDVKIVDGICEKIDALVVSLISASPQWEPASNQGKPVAQTLSIPISFEMR